MMIQEVASYRAGFQNSADNAVKGIREKLKGDWLVRDVLNLGTACIVIYEKEDEPININLNEGTISEIRTETKEKIELDAKIEAEVANIKEKATEEKTGNERYIT